MIIFWEMVHAGWYTSDLGGISLESDGWCFFPKEMAPHIGPFKTLKEAKEKASSLTRPERLPTTKGD